MVIYGTLGADGYELCHPVDQGDYERLNLMLNGVSRRAAWAPIDVEIVRKDEGKTLRDSDSPWMDSTRMILRPRATEALSSILAAHGELLPLRCAHAEVEIFNVLKMVDALDEDASEINRFTDGRIMMIRRHVFRADAVRDVDIFRIPNPRVSQIFVSQRFVDLWKSSGLRGLTFPMVWESKP